MPQMLVELMPRVTDPIVKEGIGGSPPEALHGHYSCKPLLSHYLGKYHSFVVYLVFGSVEQAKFGMFFICGL